MKIWARYSHLNWYERLLVHKKKLWKEIQHVISQMDSSQFKTKESQEKTMKGKILFSPIDLNNYFKEQLTAKWRSEKRTSYRVTDDYKLITRTLKMNQSDQKRIIEENSKTPILSYNQTDFQKERVAIEVQFWKYAFIAYDLFVKHLAFYVGDNIDVWIEILPMKSMQAQMSSWPGYYESALYDLARQGKGVPAVPLVLIWIEE